jgi:hypothetical protein
MTLLEKAHDEYVRSSVMTAGPLKSHEMLADAALSLLEKDFRNQSFDNQIQIQNLVSQLQSGLNLKMKNAQDLYKVLSVIWDHIEIGDWEKIPSIQQSLGSYKDLLVQIQRL